MGECDFVFQCHFPALMNYTTLPVWAWTGDQFQISTWLALAGLVTCLEHRFFWKEGQETKDPLSNLVSSTWNTEIKKTILSLPSQAPNEDWNNGSVNTLKLSHNDALLLPRERPSFGSKLLFLEMFWIHSLKINANFSLRKKKKTNCG